MVRYALFLAAIGLTFGLFIAIGVTRAMSSLLYETSTTDPATLFGVVVVLGGTALIASYIPARRAARVDPMIALRHE
jgi:ABC-type antimicrobial peptide transport system permease subunit